MIGNSKAPGIMVSTMRELFSRIEGDTDRKYEVRISYLEVYNETIRDLLVASIHVILLCQFFTRFQKS